MPFQPLLHRLPEFRLQPVGARLPDFAHQEVPQVPQVFGEHPGHPFLPRQRVAQAPERFDFPEGLLETLQRHPGAPGGRNEIEELGVRPVPLGVVRGFGLFFLPFFLRARSRRRRFFRGGRRRFLLRRLCGEGEGELGLQRFVLPGGVAEQLRAVEQGGHGERPERRRLPALRFQFLPAVEVLPDDRPQRHRRPLPILRVVEQAFGPRDPVQTGADPLFVGKLFRQAAEVPEGLALDAGDGQVRQVALQAPDFPALLGIRVIGGQLGAEPLRGLQALEGEILLPAEVLDHGPGSDPLQVLPVGDVQVSAEVAEPRLRVRESRRQSGRK